MVNDQNRGENSDLLKELGTPNSKMCKDFFHEMFTFKIFQVKIWSSVGANMFFFAYDIVLWSCFLDHEDEPKFLISGDDNCSLQVSNSWKRRSRTTCLPGIAATAAAQLGSNCGMGSCGKPCLYPILTYFNCLLIKG